MSEGPHRPEPRQLTEDGETAVIPVNMAGQWTIPQQPSQPRPEEPEEPAEPENTPEPLASEADEPAEPEAALNEDAEEPPEDTRAQVAEDPAADIAMNEASADDTPADEEPADGTPAHDEPTDDTRADHTPGDQTPAQPTPADAAPADRTFPDHTATDHAPAGDTFPDPTPTDPTPADHAPADPTPTDHAPADHALADDEWADGGLVDEASADDEPAEEEPAGEAEDGEPSAEAEDEPEGFEETAVPEEPEGPEDDHGDILFRPTRPERVVEPEPAPLAERDIPETARQWYADVQQPPAPPVEEEPEAPEEPAAKAPETTPEEPGGQDKQDKQDEADWAPLADTRATRPRRLPVPPQLSPQPAPEFRPFQQEPEAPAPQAYAPPPRQPVEPLTPPTPEPQAYAPPTPSPFTPPPTRQPDAPAYTPHQAEPPAQAPYEPPWQEEQQTHEPQPEAPAAPKRGRGRRRALIAVAVLAVLLVAAVSVQLVRPLPEPTLRLTLPASHTFQGAKPTLPLPQRGQVVINVEGIGTMGTSGAQTPIPTASVAKVMTAYLFLKNHPLGAGQQGPTFTISPQEAARLAFRKQRGESHVDVRAGQPFTERKALEALMVVSANNIAHELARWDAGNEAAFVAKMNAAARELGMTNTRYTDPSGYDSGTVSTAADQVKLLRAAMESPAFAEIVAERVYVPNDGGPERPAGNILLGQFGIVGGKTGYTDAAGGNYVFAARKQVAGVDTMIIGAVMGQPGTSAVAAMTVTQRVVAAAQGAMTGMTLAGAGQQAAVIDDGLGRRTPVAAAKPITVVGWPGLTVRLGIDGTPPSTAPQGTEVGNVTLGEVKFPLQLPQPLAEPDLMTRLTRLG